MQQHCPQFFYILGLYVLDFIAGVHNSERNDDHRALDG